MKQHWTHIELVKYWTLSQDEIRVIQTKNNKLVYAFKMRYFDAEFGTIVFEIKCNVLIFSF